MSHHDTLAVPPCREVPSTANQVEILAGLAPAVHCFLVWNGKQLAAHPFVPTVHAKEPFLHPEMHRALD